MSAMDDLEREALHDYLSAFERDDREAHERDIRAMMDDPGDEPGSYDLPDYETPGKEVSPFDLRDDPFDDDEDEEF